MLIFLDTQYAKDPMYVLLIDPVLNTHSKRDLIIESFPYSNIWRACASAMTDSMQVVFCPSCAQIPVRVGAIRHADIARDINNFDLYLRCCQKNLHGFTHHGGGMSLVISAALLFAPDTRLRTSGC
jgi:hypothetical protein